MARTTKTPHKVSRNKSGSPIVRASKLFSGRPTRTTREIAFETEQQARIFADALNLAAVRDGDWRWLKGEDWTAQRRYVDEVLAAVQERAAQRSGDGASFAEVNANSRNQGHGRVAATCGMSLVEAVEAFVPVYMDRPRSEAGKNYASWLGAIGMAFADKSLAEVADMTPVACGKLLKKMIDPKDTSRWHDERVVSSRTVNSRLNSLEQLLRYAIDEDWIIGQPRFFSATLWRAPKEEPSPRWWNITEMAAVRAQLLEPSGEEEIVAFLMAELLMYSGLRWGEVAALQWKAGEHGPYYWNAVNPSKSLLSIRVAWKRRVEALGPTKTGNTWSAICTNNVNDLLRRTKLVTGSGETFLFPHHDDPGTAYSYKRWCKMFKRAVDRAGVDLPRGYVQKILRHSFVFAARRATVPSKLIQQHFGHTDTRMVDRIYGRSGPEGERFEYSPGEFDQIRNFFQFDEFEEISRNVA